MTDDDTTQRPSSPTYWPGQADREEVGPIGDGTPHARMHWLWKRMRFHEDLIAELTGYSSVSSFYRFEAAIADAFDRLAMERASREVTDAMVDEALDAFRGVMPRTDSERMRAALEAALALAALTLPAEPLAPAPTQGATPSEQGSSDRRGAEPDLGHGRGEEAEPTHA